MPETLMNAVIELEEAYNKYKDDPDFVRELEDLQKNIQVVHPFILCRTHDKGPWGAKIYLKREDLKPYWFPQIKQM